MTGFSEEIKSDVILHFSLRLLFQPLCLICIISTDCFPKKAAGVTDAAGQTRRQNIAPGNCLPILAWDVFEILMLNRYNVLVPGLRYKLVLSPRVPGCCKANGSSSFCLVT